MATAPKLEASPALNPDCLLTVEQVAGILRVPRSWVYERTEGYAPDFAMGHRSPTVVGSHPTCGNLSDHGSSALARVPTCQNWFFTFLAFRASLIVDGMRVCTGVLPACRSRFWPKQSIVEGEHGAERKNYALQPLLHHFLHPDLGPRNGHFKTCSHSPGESRRGKNIESGGSDPTFSAFGRPSKPWGRSRPPARSIVPVVVFHGDRNCRRTLRTRVAEPSTIQMFAISIP